MTEEVGLINFRRERFRKSRAGHYGGIMGKEGNEGRKSGLLGKLNLNSIAVGG